MSSLTPVSSGVLSTDPPSSIESSGSQNQTITDSDTQRSLNKYEAQILEQIQDRTDVGIKEAARIVGRVGRRDAEAGERLSLFALCEQAKAQICRELDSDDPDDQNVLVAINEMYQSDSEQAKEFLVAVSARIAEKGLANSLVVLVKNKVIHASEVADQIGADKPNKLKELLQICLDQKMRETFLDLHYHVRDKKIEIEGIAEMAVQAWDLGFFNRV